MKYRKKPLTSLPTNKYLITENGEVINSQTGRVLKATVNGEGYFMIRITYLTKKYTVMPHREVAKAFIPNPQNKPEVNHKNGNKLDNSISNLEWNTKAENIKHAVRTGLKPPSLGESNGRSKLTNQQVRIIRSCLSFGVDRADLRQIFKASPTMINRIANNKIYKNA